MKTVIFSILMAVSAGSIQAAETDFQMNAKRPDLPALTDWLHLDKITRTQVQRVGSEQHAYFSYKKNGQEHTVSVNVSKDPTVYSYLFTAYLTGAPVNVKRTSPTGFVVVADLGS